MNPAMTLLPAGSSPLTRGKLWMARPTTASFGLIPTHAGKTRADDDGRAKLGAHPHSRGENKELSALNYADLGSSPLTRGKRQLRRMDSDH